MSREYRATYADAAAAGRQAIERGFAANPPLSCREKDVLLALVSQIALYSRLADRVTPQQVADYIGAPLRTVRRCLTSLQDRGVLIYRPGGRKGRGDVSYIGFPQAPETVSDPRPITAEEIAENLPEKGTTNDPLLEPVRGTPRCPPYEGQKGGQDGRKRGTDKPEKGDTQMSPTREGFREGFREETKTVFENGLKPQGVPPPTPPEKAAANERSPGQVPSEVKALVEQIRSSPGRSTVSELAPIGDLIQPKPKPSPPVSEVAQQKRWRQEQLAKEQAEKARQKELAKAQADMTPEEIAEMSQVSA